MYDPIVDEVRQARDKLWKEFDYDADRVFDYIRECEQKHPERLIGPEEFARRYRQSDDRDSTEELPSVVPVAPCERDDESVYHDPIVEEVRAIRQQIWDDCGHDVDRLSQRLQEASKAHPERLIGPDEFARRYKRTDADDVPPADDQQPRRAS